MIHGYRYLSVQYYGKYYYLFSFLFSEHNVHDVAYDAQRRERRVCRDRVSGHRSHLRTGSSHLCALRAGPRGDAHTGCQILQEAMVIIISITKLIIPRILISLLQKGALFCTGSVVQSWPGFIY